MTDLERYLIEVGREIAYPAEPPVAARAVAQIRSGPPDRQTTRRWQVVVGVAVTVLAVTAVVLVVPSARHAIADWLGIDGVRISFDHPNPSASVAVGEHLALGEETTLEEARARVDFGILFPARLGEPDSVFVGPYVSGGEVSLVYSPRRGLPESAATGVGAIVTEFQGRVDRPYFEKFALTGTEVDKVTVGDAPGFFVYGAPHILYYDRDGDPLEETPRLSGNVLVWERDGVSFRIEADVSERQALAIARSFR